jgi:site-specific DNA-methyltransferase (cytosine-N4-specific)
MPEDSDENDLNLAYQKVMLGNSVEMIPDSRQLKLLEKANKYQS